MAPFIYVALSGILPVSLLLFSVMSARRALIYTFIVGYLFLPMAAIGFSGIPDINKNSATAIAALVSVLVFDARALFRFRFRWFDLFMCSYCLIPVISGAANGLDALASASAGLTEVFTWGLPYFLARAYFIRPEHGHEALKAIFNGGLIYMPLCWFEFLMSPMLHYYVYGFHQHQWIQSMRWGGWRPTVFLQHGLAVGFWMMAATLCGIYLWRWGGVKRVFGVATGWLVTLMVITTIFCKAGGANFLLIVGLSLLFIPFLRKSARGLLVAFLLLVLMYLGGRFTGALPAETVCDAAGRVFEEGRIASLRGRLQQEDVLLQRSKASPILGFGPWGGYRLSEDGYGIVKATDGLWIIVLGKFGIVGLSLFFSMLLVPVCIALFGWPRGGPGVAESLGIAVATMIVLFYAYDCMFNAMVSPVFLFIVAVLPALSGLKIGESSRRGVRWLSRARLN